MPNQEQSPTGKPMKDENRPSDRDYRGDGPGKIGITSDRQPDLVAPSGVNEGDHGSAGEAPMAGEMLNFDDDELMSGRGNNERTGGTWEAQGADSGKLAPPREIMSNRNGPSDPERPGDKKRSS